MIKHKDSVMSARRCYVVGLKSDFGFVPDGEGSDLIGYSALKTRRGLEVDPKPIPGEALKAVKSESAVDAGIVTVREGVTCRLEAPFVNRKKVLKVLPTLLDIKLPFPVEECVYDFPSITIGRDKTRAIGVAARITDIERKLGVLSNSGIDPLIMDHEGLALWTQGLAEDFSVEGGGLLRVIVYLGLNRWTLVVGEDRDYIGAYSIDSSDFAHVGRVIKATKSNLVQSVEAGGTESAKNGSAPGVRFLLAGPCAADSGVIQNFKKKTSSVSDDCRIAKDPGFFLVRAVASRALTDGVLRCNFRSDPFVHPSVKKSGKKKAWQAAAALLFSGLLLCMVNGAAWFFVSARESQVEGSLIKMRRQLAGFSLSAKGEQAQEKVREALASRRDKLNSFMKFYKPSVSRDLNSLLDLCQKKEIKLDSISISEDEFNLKGNAISWQSPEDLSAYLRNMGFSVDMTRDESLKDERVYFALRARRVGVDEE